MRFSFTRFRVIVLIVVLSLTVVPTASAAPRDSPRFDRDGIVRVLAKFLQRLGIVSNEQITIPRP